MVTGEIGIDMTMVATGDAMLSNIVTNAFVKTNDNDSESCVCIM